jgi:succinate dehydrogenase/fumarate reductase flavoprotein subunit
VTAAMSQVCPTLEIRGAVDPAVAAEHHRLAPGAPRSCFGVIVMTEAGKNKFGPNFDFYCKVKGFVKQVHGAAGVASELKALGFDVPADVISSELAAYNAVATAGTKDAFGKTVFPDNFATALAPDAPLYIARVCPAIHYTMGGVAISASAEVLRDEPQDNPDFMDGGDKDDPLEPLPTVQRPIPGLFAAGEVTGGVHGRNRLGGCSLLECVVFGRIAGERAAHALLTPATTITRDAFVPIRCVRALSWLPVVSCVAKPCLWVPLQLP